MAVRVVRRLPADCSAGFEGLGDGHDGLPLLVGDVVRHRQPDADQQVARTPRRGYAVAAHPEGAPVGSAGRNPDPDRWAVQGGHLDFGAKDRPGQPIAASTVRSLPRRPKIGCGATRTTA